MRRPNLSTSWPPSGTNKMRRRTRLGEAICPYRGLDAFREEDSVFFFGRGSADDPKSAIGQLVRKVREHPFVMVVGRSGSGKSSLVYAGLVPALRRARDSFWNVLTLRPGPEPLRALAAAFNPRPDGTGSAEYAAKVGAEAELLRTGEPELLSHMIRQELDRSEGKPDRLTEVTPKFVSPSDPAARWTGAHGGQAFFAYSTNYLVDVENSIIVDVEATTAIRQAEVLAAKRMIERSLERFDLYPSRLLGDKRVWLSRDARLAGL
jgi:hypothetical protein